MSRGHAAVALAVLPSVGAALLSWRSSLAPCLLAPAWLLLPFVLRAERRQGDLPRAGRIAVALALGWALVCVGLFVVQIDAPLDVVARTTPTSHPPFGEHPVTRLAGWPWPGVEGASSNSLGCDHVPFAMGVDALLVNLAFWSTLAGLWLARRPTARAAALVAPAAIAAAAASLLGGWQLVPMFD